MSYKFELGEFVKDKTTGVKGTITERIEYFLDCVHYGYKLDSAGKWIDENRLERIDKNDQI